jgi:hypothetical protein
VVQFKLHPYRVFSGCTIVSTYTPPAIAPASLIAAATSLRIFHLYDSVNQTTPFSSP